MRDGPSASCCHSAAHSASASSIVVDQPLIALQHGVEHRGVRLCAADQKEHLRVRRPADAADLLSGRFAVIVQSAARRFYGIRLREPPENPPTAASARSRAPRPRPSPSKRSGGSRSSTPRPTTTPIRIACWPRCGSTRRPASPQETASPPTTWWPPGWAHENRSRRGKLPRRLRFLSARHPEKPIRRAARSSPAAL